MAWATTNLSMSFLKLSLLLMEVFSALQAPHHGCVTKTTPGFCCALTSFFTSSTLT
eukprot:CAMPEP_0113830118 /NCGR_PEP_ID=MMETSP0328-20130328/6161_1 /TAXON_ID=39455 /ORGANISM="Alexandrium minutum" /LENGTH=55 /DNA_ID=CAMNT_0000798215 /DNA_START=27 /DNA_END=191 /DNA_ORIENTATION=- /assembly_acc=CAM_ASM_000350